MNEKMPTFDDINDDLEVKRNVNNFFFAHGELLSEDFYNAWSPLHHVINYPEEEDAWKDLGPIPHYMEYFKKWYLKEINLVKKHDEEKAKRYERLYPKKLARILELSDKEKVTEIDRLADEFNKDLDRIKKERDIDRIDYFHNKAVEIIKR